MNILCVETSSTYHFAQRLTLIRFSYSRVTTYEDFLRVPQCSAAIKSSEGAHTYQPMHFNFPCEVERQHAARRPPAVVATASKPPILAVSKPAPSPSTSMVVAPKLPRMRGCSSRRLVDDHVLDTDTRSLVAGSWEQFLIATMVKKVSYVHELSVLKPWWMSLLAWSFLAIGVKSHMNGVTWPDTASF